VYRGEPRSDSQSLRFTEVAAIATSTCLPFGVGLATSAIRSTSGPPYRS
jgi:hypothetical protein